MSVIRGTPIPVVDLAILLGSLERNDPTRFVTVRVGERRLALATKEVLGIRRLADSELQALPILLENSDARLIQSIGSLDAELLVVLQTGRILPEETWRALAHEEARFAAGA